MNATGVFFAMAAALAVGVCLTASSARRTRPCWDGVYSERPGQAR